MATLIYQGESPNATAQGHYFGISTYEFEDGKYSAVIHTRTYEGMRVSSSYDTPLTVLDKATDRESAKQASLDLYRAYVAAVTGLRVVTR